MYHFTHIQDTKLCRTKLCFFTICAILIAGCSEGVNKDPLTQAIQQKPTFMNQDLVIPKNQVKGTEELALLGSPDAALRLANYRTAVFPDGKEVYWAQIAAENGSVIGMYNYAFIMAYSPSDGDRMRARFWLARVKELGGPNTTSLIKTIDENDQKFHQ